MIRVRMNFAVSCFLAGALAFASPAFAQEDRLREQLEDARSRIQQLQAERSALENRIRALETDLEASETRASAMQASVERGQEQLRELDEAVRQRTSLAANAQAQINAARREAAQARQAYEQLFAQAQAMQGRFDTQNALLDIAEEKNKALVTIGESILADYEEQTFGGRLLAREPLTQLYKVRLENEFQDFRDQVMDQRFVPEAEAGRLNAGAPESALQGGEGGSPD